MPLNSALRLILLAAIWGSSFLFMRVAVPELGAAAVAEFRVLLAALFLTMLSIPLNKRLQLRKYWAHYLQLGLFNSALPFLLFAYAATNLSASLLAILNATTPMWGAAIAVATGRQALSPRLVLGQALGILGLLILLSNDATATSAGGTWAVVATLAAAFSYGIASHYAVSAPRVDSFSNSMGSLWAAALILLPAFALYPAESVPSVDVSLSVLALGIVCSGLALLLYFKLIADEGATSALSVGFLIPVFGVFWGYALLDESVGWHTLIGALVVLTGTMLVTGFSPRALIRRAGD